MFRAPSPFPPRAPDFLCVGTQRAGTTWLFHCLDRSAGYAMPPVKELNAFRSGPAGRISLARQRQQFLQVLHRELSKGAPPDLPTLRWYARFTLDEPRDGAWYQSLFAHAGPRITGDVSPSLFGASPETIQRVRESAPQAKILVMLRDPLDRALSQLSFSRRKGWWGPELSEDEVFHRLTTGLGGAFSDYGGALARWEAAYPGRVFVFFLEDAGRDPVGTLGRVGALLGAPIDAAALGPLARRRLNAAPSVAVSPVLQARLATWLAPRIAPLRARFPEQVLGWMRHLGEAAGLG